ncbi:MAG: hypothetical protein KY461_03405 [Actinobacteria bacterium]|nr:hypothetical protein [Actinomycetota bacterium]
MSEAMREVRCACGEKLVDEVDPPEVEVDGERIPFRRSTDFLACPACRSLYRVTDVGNELVTNGPVVFDPPPPA